VIAHRRHIRPRAVGRLMACIAAATVSPPAHAEPPAATRSVPTFEFAPIRHGGRNFKPHLESKSGSAPVASDEARIHRYKAISLVEKGGPLGISFRPPQGASRFASRLQFKLEGYDADWRDLPKGSVHLVLKFFDSNRVPISREEFRASGNSVGWTGDLMESSFADRSGRAVVPPRAEWVDVWIDSGGHDETSGVWLVDDLLIRQSGTGGDPAVLLAEDFESGRGLDQPQGDFTRWVRDGGALSDALVWSGPPAIGGHALLIRDSNPRDYAAWRLKARNLLPVVAGSTLDLSWREVYSIGTGRNGDVFYYDLPGGQYQFRVREVDALGVPTGEEAVLPFIIAPPLHANLWFRAALIISLLAILLSMERFAARRRMHRKLEELKRAEAVQNERARIARDIHDDLGTVLSRISMVSEAAVLDAEPGSTQKQRLHEICEISRQLTRTMEEIVWAQDPRHDSLDNTVSYICSFASDLLGVAHIACRFDIPLELPHLPLTAEQRHEVFLVFKEALNNIIKHSAATEVRISLRLTNGVILLIIEDNGRGFEIATLPDGKGNGLHNMKNRLHRLGGTVEIQSTPAGGTRVEIVQPIHAKAQADD
jgi:signal transduction histidine kinase